jgi:hypothetical protein
MYFRVDAQMDASLIFATFLFVKAAKGLIWKKIHKKIPYVVEVETSQFTIFKDWLVACHQNTKGKCGIPSLTYSQIWLALF